MARDFADHRQKSILQKSIDFHLVKFVGENVVFAAIVRLGNNGSRRARSREGTDQCDSSCRGGGGIRGKEVRRRREGENSMSSTSRMEPGNGPGENKIKEYS